MEDRIFIDLTSWGACFNGEHYSGYIYGPEGRTELTHKMTTGLASRLNKKDGTTIYKPGETTGRFETKESAIRKGIETAREKYPDARIVILGDCSTANPQQVAWCADEAKMAVLNEIWKEQEILYADDLNPYREHGEKMDELFRRWESGLAALYT